MSQRPLFSIVVPSFNQGRYLRRTLDSILGQDYRPLEVIVSDGGSKDESVEILKEYSAKFPELRWWSAPDKGVADAVNKGLAQARGTYVGIQSSDDLYYPGAISAAAAAFEQHPDCGFVYGDVEGIDENDVILYRARPPAFSWPAFFAVSCCLPQGSIFFSNALAQTLGGWRGDYYSCDLDFWLRLAFQTRPVKIERVLSAWRRYSDQRTRPDQFRRLCDDYRRMIDESPEVQSAPASVRRLARASKHLLVIRLAPPDYGWLQRWRELTVGAALHPGFWKYNQWQLVASQFPGFAALRAVYRKLRSLSGRTPQPTRAPLLKPD